MVQIRGHHCSPFFVELLHWRNPSRFFGVESPEFCCLNLMFCSSKPVLSRSGAKVLTSPWKSCRKPFGSFEALTFIGKRHSFDVLMIFKNKNAGQNCLKRFSQPENWNFDQHGRFRNDKQRNCCSGCNEGKLKEQKSQIFTGQMACAGVFDRVSIYQSTWLSPSFSCCNFPDGIFRQHKHHLWNPILSETQFWLVTSFFVFILSGSSHE